MNRHAIWAIYRVEMARTMRTLLQSVVSPVISTLVRNMRASAVCDAMARFQIKS